MTTLFLTAFCTFLVGGGLFLTREPLAIPSAAILTGVLPGVALAHIARVAWRGDAPAWTPFAANALLVAIMLVWAAAAWAFVHEVHKANTPRALTILVVIRIWR